jgi:hypothetical protein
MKAKVVGSLFAIVFFGIMMVGSISIVGQGLTDKKIASANPQISALSADEATARLSKDIPALWVEISGTILDSKKDGWAWLALERGERIVPVKLEKKGKGPDKQASPGIQGLVEILGTKEAAKLPEKPTGKTIMGLILRAGASPSGGLWIWTRIIGGIVFTAFLGLTLIGLIITIFGDSGTTSRPTYRSDFTQHVSRSEMRG